MTSSKNLILRMLVSKKISNKFCVLSQVSLILCSVRQWCYHRLSSKANRQRKLPLKILWPKFSSHRISCREAGLTKTLTNSSHSLTLLAAVRWREDSMEKLSSTTAWWSQRRDLSMLKLFSALSWTSMRFTNNKSSASILSHSSSWLWQPTSREKTRLW